MLHLYIHIIEYNFYNVKIYKSANIHKYFLLCKYLRIHQYELSDLSIEKNFLKKGRLLLTLVHFGFITLPYFSTLY